MRLADRITWALAIVLVDVVTVGVPLAAFLLADVLLARPPWFRTWVAQLYHEPPR